MKKIFFILFIVEKIFLGSAMAKSTYVNTIDIGPKYAKTLTIVYRPRGEPIPAANWDKSYYKNEAQLMPVPNGTSEQVCMTPINNLDFRYLDSDSLINMNRPEMWVSEPKGIPKKISMRWEKKLPGKVFGGYIAKTTTDNPDYLGQNVLIMQPVTMQNVVVARANLTSPCAINPNNYCMAIPAQADYYHSNLGGTEVRIPLSPIQSPYQICAENYLPTLTLSTYDVTVEELHKSERLFVINKKMANTPVSLRLELPDNAAASYLSFTKNELTTLSPGEIINPDANVTRINVTSIAIPPGGKAIYPVRLVFSFV
ncbi:hypothetical protein XS28_22910 [Salmonella enterica subsp. enterica]|nr:hypothetical protein [Salmonella enterica subsp. enterica]EDV0655969.1 hypothetical protein [Salmonella enterica subsp. enterica]